MNARKRNAGRPDWIEDFAENGKPRYIQIVEFIEHAVASGTLNPGDRLPPQRRLAEMLGVDLTTVTRGFSEAHRRNLIESRGPQGTFVAPPTASLMQRVDLSMNIPPAPPSMDLALALKRGLSQVLVRNDLDLLMTYQVGGGSEADRQAGARWLEPILGQVDPARVVVVPGAHTALAALLLTLTRPGDAIFVEQLTYPGLALIAGQLDRRITPLACDDDGMRPDALDKATAHAQGGLLYLNPTLRNPTTRTMSARRRKDILAVVARRNLKVIEDDPYYLFGDRTPAPLAGLAPQHVYYLSTLSKCVSPGLRAAFLVLPSPAGHDGFFTALRSLALMSPPLTTTLVTQWILDGTASAVMKAILEESRDRRLVADQILASAGGTSASGGIHVWQTLPDHWDARNLSTAARGEGLVVAPSSAFYQGDNPPNAIRISLGGGTRSNLAAALRKLASLLAETPRLEQQLVV